jgi:hypothetical protein
MSISGIPSSTFSPYQLGTLPTFTSRTSKSSDRISSRAVYRRRSPISPPCNKPLRSPPPLLEPPLPPLQRLLPAPSLKPSTSSPPIFSPATWRPRRRITPPCSRTFRAKAARATTCTITTVSAPAGSETQAARILCSRTSTNSARALSPATLPSLSRPMQPCSNSSIRRPSAAEPSRPPANRPSRWRRDRWCDKVSARTKNGHPPSVRPQLTTDDGWPMPVTAKSSYRAALAASIASCSSCSAARRCSSAFTPCPAIS